MAIFTAIGAAVAGALFGGSLFAATVIATGLALGASLLVSYLMRPKARPYSAVQGQIQFGADVPDSTVYGTAKVKGQRVFYAKYGSGNKFNAEVFVLANGWCDGLEPEVYFYGEKHDLTSRTIIDNEIAHYGVDGFGDAVSIRFYDGRPGQGVDTKLVSDTASLGKTWKSTSVCTGLCYVVVEREWSEALFPHGRPEFDFVLRGLREYDPRYDDTAGGDGDQRLNDMSTWVHTNNPAIHRLNYLLGVKGYQSGRTLIGAGKPVQAIDVASHIAAANVCDTPRGEDDKPTYACSLFVTAEDDQTEILREFEDAMAGYAMNRNGFAGVLAGAPQVPVLEITTTDIRQDDSQQIRFRKSAFDLYNELSGQFTSPESHWKPESLKTVIVNDDVSKDGRRRPGGVDLLQITDADTAQYVLNIRYRQNRKGGSGTIPVSRRVGLAVEVGVWVEYLGRTWLVTGRAFDSRLRFTLKLSETGSDVYAEEGIEPGPIIVPPSPSTNPALLSTIQDFAVEVGMTEGAEGFEVPTLRFTWTPPNDPTITAVRFEYHIQGEPGRLFRDETGDPEAGEYETSKDVISGVHYVARATIRTVPDRFKTWAGPLTTDNPTGSAKSLAALSAMVEALLQVVEQRIPGDHLAVRQELDSLAASLNAQVTVMREQQGRINIGVGEKTEANRASAEFSLLTATGARNALAAIFGNTLAVTEAGQAETLLKMVSSSDLDEGVLALIELATAAGFGGLTAKSGLQLVSILQDGIPISRVRLIGGQVEIVDGQGVARDALLFTQSGDPLPAPIGYEGFDRVIRADITGRNGRHYTLLDSSAEMRVPKGVVPMDYIHIVERTNNTNLELTCSEEFLLPHPELSDIPNSVNVLRCSVLGTNPIEIVATKVAEAVRVPTLVLRLNTITLSGNFDSDLSSNINSNWFKPGDAIFAVATQHRRSPSVQPSQAVSANAVPDWSEVVSAYGGYSGGGGQYRAVGTRVLWKIADGNESSIQPFVTSGPGSFHTELWVWYFIYKFLGAKITICPDPMADAGSTSGSTFSHLIKTGDANPSVAISIAHIFNTSTVPDQSFDPSPLVNTPLGPLGGNFFGTTRMKFSHNPGSDVTSELAAPGGIGTRSLATFGFKLG